MRAVSRSLIGTVVGMVCSVSLYGCVVVVGNESRVHYGDAARTPRWRLGVTLDEVDNATAAQLGLKCEHVSLITQVITGSPADHAGLKQYDIITRVGPSDDACVSDVLDAIRAAKLGEPFTLTVLREGKPMDVTAMLRD